jgi:3-hydroxybutyryl-CoA dehydrogenase
MPTFLNIPLMEVSVWRDEDKVSLAKTCADLNTKFSLVDDRVGLVTPRIISMIINEAYYTVQEGTASREDIDNAMKLGTNYPYGPFEWCERIGTRYVYELLDALYEETKDERYKICALLKKDYLKVEF